MRILPEYPELSIHYLEANLSPETAALAAGYEAICAFVNANIGAETVEQLHRQGVKLNFNALCRLQQCRF